MINYKQYCHILEQRLEDYQEEIKQFEKELEYEQNVIDFLANELEKFVFYDKEEIKNLAYYYATKEE